MISHFQAIIIIIWEPFDHNFAEIFAANIFNRQEDSLGIILSQNLGP